MGLALGGVACAQRRAWVWAGVLLGLAVTSQQFALLVVAPLVVVAPGNRRWRFIVSSLAVWVLVSLPVVVATSGRALHAVVFGTGDSASPGGTVLWEIGLHGSALIFGARVLPILVAVVLAWWALRRLASHVLEPVPLISLVANITQPEARLRTRSLWIQVYGSRRNAHYPRRRSRRDPRTSHRMARSGDSRVQSNPSGYRDQLEVVGICRGLWNRTDLHRVRPSSHRLGHGSPEVSLVRRRLVRHRSMPSLCNGRCGRPIRSVQRFPSGFGNVVVSSGMALAVTPLVRSGRRGDGSRTCANVTSGA